MLLTHTVTLSDNRIEILHKGSPYFVSNAFNSMCNFCLQFHNFPGGTLVHEGTLPRLTIIVYTFLTKAFILHLLTATHFRLFSISASHLFLCLPCLLLPHEFPTYSIFIMLFSLVVTRCSCRSILLPLISWAA